MNPITYIITDWAGRYENKDTRKLKALRWVPIPNQHDGLSFRRLAVEASACELYAAWCLIVQLASKGGPDERGRLERDGLPLTAGDMALMTGFPVEAFTRALAFFSTPRMGWLATATPTKSPDDLPLFPGTPGNDPMCPPKNPAEGRKEGRKEGNGNNTSTPPPASCEGEKQEASPAKPRKTPARREPDPLFEALCAVVGTPPAELTPQAARTTAVSLAAIRSACKNAAIELTAEEIEARGRAYRRQFTTAPLTAPGLANQWARLGSAASAGPKKKPAPLPPEPEHWPAQFCATRGGSWSTYANDPEHAVVDGTDRVFFWKDLPADVRAELTKNQPAANAA